MCRGGVPELSSLLVLSMSTSRLLAGLPRLVGALLLSFPFNFRRGWTLLQRAGLSSLSELVSKLLQLQHSGSTNYKGIEMDEVDEQ